MGLIVGTSTQPKKRGDMENTVHLLLLFILFLDGRIIHFKDDILNFSLIFLRLMG